MATDIWAGFLPGKESDPWADFQPVKPREWKDVPLEALKNAPNSAAHLIGGVVHAVSHPLETAQNLGDLAVGTASNVITPFREGVQKVMGYGPEAVDPELQKKEQLATATGQFFANRYGSMEGLKNTLATDPVGALADAATVLPGAGALLKLGPKATFIPEVGQAVTAAGRYANPFMAPEAVLKAGAKVAEPVVSNALGFATGAGADAVRQAYQSGKAGQGAFLENMRGNVPMTDVLDQAKGALSALRDERNAAYQTGMANVRGDKTVLDLAPIEQALQGTTGIGSFEGKTTNAAAVNTREKLATVLADWKGSDPSTYHTPAGLDALKKAVGAIREETQPHTQSRIVADRVYHAVGDTIKAQAPTYAGTMGDYANASKQIGEIERTFSLGEKAAQDTGMRKLQSVMRNNVNTNFGNRQVLAEALAERAPDLKAAIAGQSMSSATPRGLAKIAGPTAVGGVAAAAANPYLLAMLAGSSPRLVGEAAYAAGRGSGVAGKAAGSAGITADRARLLELLSYQGDRATNEQLRKRLLQGAR